MAQFQLVMHSGPTPGKTFPLDGDVLTIGREASNAITINDAEVSRKHTQLVFQGGKYIITDLGSTNGTFVNGQRLTGQHVLQPGEIISLGEQINLLYEAIAVVDPNATMVSPAARGMSAPPPPAPRPAPQYPPAQPAGYAGQIPAGPDVGYVPAPQQGGGNRTIIIAVVVLVLLCCCGIVGLIAYDAMNLWCSPLTSWLVPFIGGGACTP